MILGSRPCFAMPANYDILLATDPNDNGRTLGLDSAQYSTQLS
jgi:hypothetical protein